MSQTSISILMTAAARQVLTAASKSTSNRHQTLHTLTKCSKNISRPGGATLHPHAVHTHCSGSGHALRSVKKLFSRCSQCECRRPEFTLSRGLRSPVRNNCRVGEFLCCSRTSGISSLPKHKLVIRQQICYFHTSPRRQIPPVLLMLMKPVAKITAALTGRSVRKWFRRLGPEERKKVVDAIKRHWYIPAGLSATLIGSGVAYYYSHIEETPITGRKRFVALTHDQILKIANEETKTLVETYGKQLLTVDDVETLRVYNVMSSLLKANPEMNSNLPFDKWEIFVINNPLCNACVLPNGCVFVFKGMLDMASTQDELAIVMGHEVAHAVLSHGVEELSLAAFVDYFVILCLAAMWCVIPTDGIALVTHWFYNKVISLLTHMPHSREVEREADKVGLLFAARACYDVRAGSVLWHKMALNERIQEDGTEVLPLPEWMSTHPDSKKRAEHLDFLLPQAESWRDLMKCPCLPKEDPRKAMAATSQKVKDIITAKKANQNLVKVTKAE